MPLLDGFIPSVGSDYVAGGQYGVTANRSILSNPDIRRPYFDKKGWPRVLVNTGETTLEKGEQVPIKRGKRIVDLMAQGLVDPVFLTANSTALRKEQWIELDRVVQKEYRLKLRAWADLMATNSYGGFNGMARMTLEYEAMSDPGEAVVDMDGLGEGRQDSPLFLLRSMPLPITHSDFWFSERRLAISGNGGTPFDTTMAEACSRRIGESVERTTIGTQAGVTYGTQTAGYGTHDGTSTVYGYLNHPDVFSKNDFTAPTAGGWVPNTTFEEVLTFLAQMKLQGVTGPFRMYYSSDWFKYMNRKYTMSNSEGFSTSLLKELQSIPGISGVTELEFLPGTFTFIFVQMTSDVCRAVEGLPIKTLQWPSQAGMRINYKIMTISVPQVKSTFSNLTGIGIGTTA